MPTSNLAIAPLVVNHVETLPRPAGRGFRILDVGPGWGKYATLLREYLNVPKPERIDAVEAWAPYVDEHRLDVLYDRVIIGDVLDLDDTTLASYDVVMMVDVIEHIDKTAAVELLSRIPGAVVICTPVEFFPNPADLPPPEAHISHWTVDDFDATGRRGRLEVVLGGIVVTLRPA